jgi:hypothetical protein
MLVLDCCYLSLDNFAAVKANPDAGADAAIHSGSIILDLNLFEMRAEMTLTDIAARLRKDAADRLSLSASFSLEETRKNLPVSHP